VKERRTVVPSASSVAFRARRVPRVFGGGRVGLDGTQTSGEAAGSSAQMGPMVSSASMAGRSDAQRPGGSRWADADSPGCQFTQQPFGQIDSGGDIACQEGELGVAGVESTFGPQGVLDGDDGAGLGAGGERGPLFDGPFRGRDQRRVGLRWWAAGIDGHHGVPFRGWDGARRGRLLKVTIVGSLLREGPLPCSWSLVREGSKAVLPPVAIVWACRSGVEEYVAAGREVVTPRPFCPGCGSAMVFWSGYQRSVRVGGRCRRLWVRRVRCGGCEVSHALIPAFCLVGRLDVVDCVGEAITAVVVGGVGVRPVADRLGVPHTTARGWWRRFRIRAAAVAAGFSAVAVELSGEAPGLPAGVDRAALAAMGWAWAAAVARAGTNVPGLWVFVSLVTGGMWLAANTDPPWLVFAGRRLIPPIP
jgi:hypothetical protein